MPPGVGKKDCRACGSRGPHRIPTSLLRNDWPFVEIDGSAIIHDFRNNINPHGQGFESVQKVV